MVVGLPPGFADNRMLHLQHLQPSVRVHMAALLQGLLHLDRKTLECNLKIAAIISKCC